MNKICTIILNYNCYEKTKKCLDSLLGSSIKTDIIFIDNGSADNSSQRLKEEYSKKLPIEFIFTKENLGYPRGVNIGIKKAMSKGYEFVFLLNNDAYILPDTIEKLIEAFEVNEKVMIAGPTIFYYHDPQKIWQAGGRFNWFKLGVSIYFKNKKINLDGIKSKFLFVDFLSACIWLVKTDLFKKVGLFNEKLFLYYDDLDLCLKTKKLGYQIVYVPHSIAYHDIGDITKTRTKPITLYNLGRSYFIFVKELSNSNFLLILYAVFLFLFAYTPFRFWQLIIGKVRISNIYYWFKGGWDGLFTERFYFKV